MGQANTTTGLHDLSGLGAASIQLLMQNNMNPQLLRVNGPLKDKEQTAIDTAVVRVAQERLVIAGDLIGRGLTFNVDVPLGTTSVEHHKASDISAAQTAMSPIARVEGDLATMTAVTTPNPLTFKDFQLDVRAVQASRRMGTNLDISLPQMAARQVAEQIENIILNGAGPFGGSSVYGLLTEPNRNTFTFESNLAWDAVTKTGTNILADTLSAIKQAEADNYYGPYLLYVTDSYYNALQVDLKANSGKSIAERLRSVDQIIDVKPASKLPADTIVLVQPEPDVIDLIVGDLSGQRQSGQDVPAIPITTVPWETHGGMLLNFKVIADIVPRVKSTASGQSGVVVGTPT